MAVKYLPTGKVHRGKVGKCTGCGFDTKKNPTFWERASERINCNKKGCKKTIPVTIWS
jgi:hypothetical protein